MTVLHATPPSTEALEREARAVCETVAAVLGCPVEHVHAEYAPAGRGRMAFGGQLLC